jgi:OOP family OmpA-OmpF porin
VVPPLPKLPELEPIHAVIDFGASGLKLDEAGQKAIDPLLDALTKLGGPVILRGHSDSHGSDGDNRVASRIRAEKVRDYLVGKGIAKDRIQLIALGEARPIAPNAHPDGSDDPDGRARNRRVEIDAEPAASPAEIPPPK